MAAAPNDLAAVAPVCCRPLPELCAVGAELATTAEVAAAAAVCWLLLVVL